MLYCTIDIFIVFGTFQNMILDIIILYKSEGGYSKAEMDARNTEAIRGEARNTCSVFCPFW